ncbi:DNA alkylation repair protein [Candidatus Roizmanbacteria bacterium]|nr:DNA alkylation repair protein [Candidatus Roizmanbacteria bacterium]
MNSYTDVETALQALKNAEKAQVLQRFFKTGKGQYGEGDIFLGIVVPEQRKVSKLFSTITLEDIHHLLISPIHEYRLTALFILILQYQKADEHIKKNIFDFYLKHTAYVNNWDLVDLSAPNIVGDYLLMKDHSLLYILAQSENIWEKRIAILATYTFIRSGQYEDTLRISELLLQDKHDLIHKAVGWMLRELGKRDQKIEEEFLKKQYRTMPRTMLRYAIEKFDRETQLFYLAKP